MNVSRILLLGLVLVESMILCFAGPARAERYAVRAFTEADGLPSSQVTSLGQDPRGRLWFVTRTTVAAYDGAEFEELRRPDGEVLRGFEHVRFDDRGEPWLVRPKGGFVRRLDDRWIEVRSPPAGVGEGVRAVSLVRVGERTQLALGLYSDGLAVWDGSDWRRYSESDGLPSPRVLCLVEEDGALLVGTDRGLARYRDGVVEPVPPGEIPLPPGPILGMARDTDDGPTAGRLWVQSTDWLGYVESGVLHRIAESEMFPAAEPDDTVYLLPDGDRGVYRGGRIAMQYVDASDGTVLRFGQSNGFTGDGSRHLFRDRDRGVWIATDRGCNRLDGLGFVNFDERSGLLADEVTAILERRSGELVLGHNGGLTLYDGRGFRRVPLAPEGRAPGLTRVLDLEEDAAGNLWVAASNLGAGRVAADGSVTWFRPPDARRSVASITLDENGDLLVGGYTELAVPRAGRLVPLREPGMPSWSTRRIQLGDARRLYVSTPEGLFARDAGRWTRLRSEEGDGFDNIYGALDDSRGRTWVGTAAGLLRLDGGQLRRPHESALRFSRPVYFVVEDRQRRLWFGTDRGVMRWDGEAIRRFGRSSGVVGNETNRAAAVLDRHGRLWFGTDRGLSRFDPRHDRPLGPPPVIELTELKVRDASHPLSDEIALRADDNDLTFALRVVSLVDGDPVRVSTRLAGYEDEAVMLSGAGRHVVRYTNLAPGTYRLLVSAKNAEGPWSPEIASASIVVARPFWTPGTFVATCVIALAGLALAVQRYLLRRAETRRLERRVRERTAQLRRSEREMAAERERLAAVLASVGDGVIATDRDGRIILVNRAAQRLVGRQADEVLGRPLGAVVSLAREAEPGVALETAALLARRAQDAREFDPYVLHDSAGERRVVELQVAPLHESASESSGFVVAIQDVTERRRFEQRLARAARLSSLGALARGIAHDFNNVLTAAMGSVSLVARRGEKDDENLATAERALERAAGLSRQLLTFSRGGSPVKRPLAIGAVLREAAELAFSGSMVSCRQELSEALWPAEADETQMHQVFQNLLINARQAMPDGGRVTLRAENLETDGARFIKVTIRDEGVGIKREDLERIFDPFFTTKSAGTGLGLATTHSIVTRHGGSIEVDSTPGAGTTIVLLLPAAAELAVPPREERPPRTDTGTARILVMDDEESVRGVLGSILAHLGFEAALTADGAEAVEIFAAARDVGDEFDLVILDLTVPGGLGGIETLERLRRIDPDVCALASSGYSEDPVMASDTDFGFSGSLPKPYRVDDVARVLQGAIRARTGAA